MCSEIAKRVVTDVDALRSLKEDINSGNRGVLTIATTHTQARYVLPMVIEKFVKKYPEVELILKQGNPEDICNLVDSGEADLAIGTDTLKQLPNLVKLPCFSLPRSVVAKIGHPILDVNPLTLEEIARYPIISYDPRYSGRWRVMNAFKKANIEPKVILSAIDADVCKTYIELGLGIGVLTTITFDPKRDTRLARETRRLPVRGFHDLHHPARQYLPALVHARLHQVGRAAAHAGDRAARVAGARGIARDAALSGAVVSAFA